MKKIGLLLATTLMGMLVFMNYHSSYTARHQEELLVPLSRMTLSLSSYDKDAVTVSFLTKNKDWEEVLIQDKNTNAIMEVLRVKTIENNTTRHVEVTRDLNRHDKIVRLSFAFNATDVGDYYFGDIERADDLKVLKLSPDSEFEQGSKFLLGQQSGQGYYEMAYEFTSRFKQGNDWLSLREKDTLYIY